MPITDYKRIPDNYIDSLGRAMDAEAWRGAPPKAENTLNICVLWGEREDEVQRAALARFEYLRDYGFTAPIAVRISAVDTLKNRIAAYLSGKSQRPVELYVAHLIPMCEDIDFESIADIAMQCSAACKDILMTYHGTQDIYGYFTRPELTVAPAVIQRALRRLQDDKTISHIFHFEHILDKHQVGRDIAACDLFLAGVRGDLNARFWNEFDSSSRQDLLKYDSSYPQQAEESYIYFSFRSRDINIYTDLALRAVEDELNDDLSYDVDYNALTKFLNPEQLRAMVNDAFAGAMGYKSFSELSRAVEEDKNRLSRCASLLPVNVQAVDSLDSGGLFKKKSVIPVISAESQLYGSEHALGDYVSSNGVFKHLRELFLKLRSNNSVPEELLRLTELLFKRAPRLRVWEDEAARRQILSSLVKCRADKPEFNYTATSIESPEDIIRFAGEKTRYYADCVYSDALNIMVDICADYINANAPAMATENRKRLEPIRLKIQQQLASFSANAVITDVHAPQVEWLWDIISPDAIKKAAEEITNDAHKMRDFIEPVRAQLSGAPRYIQSDYNSEMTGLTVVRSDIDPRLSADNTHWLQWVTFSHAIIELLDFACYRYSSGIWYYTRNSGSTA